MAKPFADLSDKLRRTEALGQIEALESFFDKWFTNEEGALVAAFHPFEGPDQFQDYLEHHLRKLIDNRLAAAGVSQEDGVAPAPTWLERSPFRGLAHFDFEHEPIFFGRTKAIGEVIDRLKRQALGGRAFLLVLGMSGSGKSSLIRAGVLPALSRPGVIEGVGLCRRVILRPGDGLGDVFDALATALFRKEALPELADDGTSVAQLAQSLREHPDSAAIMVKGAISQAAGAFKLANADANQPQARLLLLVDQLEELFTNEKISPEDRSKFSCLLTSLACNPLSQTWVIATLRSDFYAPLAQVPGLADLKEGLGQYDLLSPSPAEIGMLVREPATAAGLRFERKPEGERLDDVLRDEASQDPSLLPSLDFTLHELYDRRTDRGELTLEAYQNIGGVKGALAQRAESTFADLPKHVQRELPAILRKLVTIGTLSDETPTRRQCPRSQFDESPARMTFVEAFIAARLFVSDLAEDGSAVVRIAHESLLGRWERVRRWLADDRELLRVKSRVERAAARWLQEGRRADLLLTAGKPLEEAEQLHASGFELEPDIADFIGASRERALVESPFAPAPAALDAWGVDADNRCRCAYWLTICDEQRLIPSIGSTSRQWLQMNSDLLPYRGSRKRKIVGTPRRCVWQRRRLKRGTSPAAAPCSRRVSIPPQSTRARIRMAISVAIAARRQSSDFSRTRRSSRCRGLLSRRLKAGHRRQ